MVTVEGMFGEPPADRPERCAIRPDRYADNGSTALPVFFMIIHTDSQDIDRASLQITYNTIGRFFLWGGLLAVAIALLLTYVLSRRILAPVKALTGATREFGKGDFSRRVDFKDKGEMGELARSFNTMADDLERNERLRRNMVADIAHELRTPLSNLRGYLEAISDGLVKPDETTIHSLSDEASSLSRLVDDLQELSLADAGELKLVLQPEDISRLIKETVTASQTKVAAKGITVSTDFPASLPELNIDSHRIKQVLYNLLDNAVAHTGRDGRITRGRLARRRPGVCQRGGHRRRHPGGRPAVYLRAFLPRGQVTHAGYRRHRPWPDDSQTSGGGAWRQDRCPEQTRGGHDIYLQPARVGKWTGRNNFLIFVWHI